MDDGKIEREYTVEMCVLQELSVRIIVSFVGFILINNYTRYCIITRLVAVSYIFCLELEIHVIVVCTPLHACASRYVSPYRMSCSKH